MKLISTLLSITISLHAFAQGFTKKFPVTITRFDIGLYSNTDFTENPIAKKALIDNSGKLTPEQFKMAMTLAQEANFPEGINSVQEQMSREEDMWKYKGYWQGSWLQTNASEGWALKLNLIWIPREDNAHMPADMIPADKDGIFFVVNNYGINGDSVPLSPVPTTAFIAEMKKKHNKLQPAVIESASEKAMSGYGRNMPFAYYLLSVKGTYTDAEYARLTELSDDINWPKPFNTRKYDDAHKQAYTDITKYKTYKVASFNDDDGKVDLYWVPQEENKHMPAEMQPLTSEGFFIATKDSEEENPYMTFMIRGSTPRGRLGHSMAGKAGRNRSSSPLALVGAKETTSPASTTYTTNSGVQVSSANMSQFSNNRRLGTMMLYYGYGGKISSVYMYELRGKELTDKQAVASMLASKISGSGYIGFEWLAGYDCNMAKGFVYKKTNSTAGTHCEGEYKID